MPRAAKCRVEDARDAGRALRSRPPQRPWRSTSTSSVAEPMSADGPGVRDVGEQRPSVTTSWMPSASASSSDPVQKPRHRIDGSAPETSMRSRGRVGRPGGLHLDPRPHDRARTRPSISSNRGTRAWKSKNSSGSMRAKRCRAERRAHELRAADEAASPASFQPAEGTHDRGSGRPSGRLFQIWGGIRWTYIMGLCPTYSAPPRRLPARPGRARSRRCARRALTGV